MVRSPPSQSEGGRLEPWPRIRAEHPSFETAAQRARPPQDEESVRGPAPRHASRAGAGILLGEAQDTRKPMPPKKKTMPERVRIDRLLVDRGLFESRAQAQAAIAAGLVLANAAPVTKASLE